MNVKECAKYWERSESWLYRHWHELGGYKVGSKIQFDIDEQKEIKKTFKKRFQIKLTIPFLFNTLPAGGNKIATSKRGRKNYGFGTVYKKKINKWTSKNWTIDFVNENGKRIQKVVPHAESRQEAEYALMFEVQKSFDRKFKIERRRREIGFTAFAQIYLEDYAMITKRSWKTDGYRLKNLKEFFKDIELREITPLMIQKFRAWRLKAGVSKVTTNREIQLLKKIFNVAIDESYLNENPATKIKLYSELDTVRDRVLSEEEEPALFKELAEHVRPLVFVALNTGMRRGELLNLKWQNVDFEKRQIKVEKTKSKKVRFIPINSVLFDKLSSLKLKSGKEQRVFPFTFIQTAWENARRRAGLEDLNFHDLRRTFGTRLLEAGVDIVTISKLYGHSTVLVTQRYLHPKDKLSREAVELLVKDPRDKLKQREKDKVSDKVVTIKNQSTLIN